MGSCSEGRFNGGFFALRLWGAYIWRGLYTEGLSSEFYGIGLGKFLFGNCTLLLFFFLLVTET